MKTEIQLPMKPLHYLGALTAALAITFAGCSKDGAVDTSKVESTFSAAEPSAKSQVDQIVTAVKAGDFAAASAPLQALASNAKLTPDQQQAIKDLMTQVQEKVKEAAAKVAEQTAETVKKAQDGAADAMKKAQEGTGNALKSLGDKVKP